MTKDKITLLLVLKGRHQFTERWLRYANSHLKNMYGLKAQGGAHPRSFRDFAAFAV